jgi:hypothetical protein
MSNENHNHVSYFLLLIVLALAIYYLLQQDHFTNTSDNIYVTNDYSNNLEELQIPTQPPIQQPTMQPVQQSLTTMDEMSPNDNMSTMDNQTTTQINPNVELFNPATIDASLFNFTPNDESVHDWNGVNLNDAFNLPLPTGVNVDAIDFKKGNMDNYNAKDFLPKEINDEWFETDFSLAKYQLNDDKLINTERYIIGINTVGQSLKNASYDIRGTIPNPKFAVSPWMNSTYEPDFNLKPLC